MNFGSHGIMSTTVIKLTTKTWLIIIKYGLEQCVKIAPVSDTQVGRMAALFPLPKETRENTNTMGSV